MENINMKNLLKISGFGAILIILLSILSVVFDGGDLADRGSVIYYDRRIAELSNEQEGQIDVLFLGDSLCGVGFCSPTLYRDYGITSYNAGKEMQKPVETYYWIREAIKKQPVKVVMLEPHGLLRELDGLDPWGYGLAEALRYRFPFLRYHSFWKFCTDGRSIRKYFKGFIVDETVNGYDGPVPYYDPEDPDTYPMPWESGYMLTKIQKLCERNGIKLVLVGAVSPVCYNTQVNRRFEKEAQERGLEFLDLNCKLDKIGIDWVNDYSDKGDHVNEYGAEKVARYLGGYLSKEYGLEDHRGDPGYESWDDMLAKYGQEVIDLEGTNYFHLEDEAGIQRQIRVLTEMDSNK